ncbi:hypothetical protein OIV83_003687 [Microbotryomycetes sp. JL201]|nr:hypothetical protein OIV83_003687 [Microbotryomycetes sp. JL201]
MLHRIARLPQHRHIKRQARALLAFALLGMLAVVTAVATSIGIGKRDVYLRYDLYLEYIGSLLLVVVGFFFSGVTYNDVRTLQEPGQLVLDIARVAASNGGTMALLVLLFIKKKSDVYHVMQECGSLPASANMPEWCARKLGSLKADAGFVVAIAVLGTTTLSQVVMFVMLFRSRLVNPPKPPHDTDRAHGGARVSWITKNGISWSFQRRLENDVGLEPLITNARSLPSAADGELGRHDMSLDGDHDAPAIQSDIQPTLSVPSSGYVKKSGVSDMEHSDEGHWSESSTESTTERRHTRTIVGASRQIDSPL